VDSDDAGGAHTSEQVFANVVDGIKKGGDLIVLQHDVKPYSVEAVEGIIQYALENNYVFAKLTPDSFAAHHSVNN
jgi:peptidoglycan/xylan/chitin deacetylase (PgdA/CDA1 family)